MTIAGEGCIVLRTRQRGDAAHIVPMADNPNVARYLAHAFLSPYTP